MRRASVLLSFLSLCGCADAKAPASATELTPSQRASVERTVANLKQASRESFERDDWSIMAAFYPKNAFSCWNVSGEDLKFGFLSMTPIPDDATYTIGSIEDYDLMGMHTMPVKATHFLLIAYEETLFKGCELPNQKRWPERHFYLRNAGEEFTLVTLCPPEGSDVTTRVWPVTSGKRALDVVHAMSDAERKALRDLVKKDRFPLNAMNALQKQYQLTEDESAIALDRICGS